jgi:hypothetical protein
VILLGVLGPAVAQDAGSVKVIAGVDYSSGDYGGEVDTETWFVPLTLKYERLPWTAKVVLPWLRITGPGGVVGAGEGAVVVGPSARRRATESGLGDIVLSGTYSLAPAGDEGPFIDVTAKVKLGTADKDKGLGTGENDYILQVDLARVYGKLTPLATLGYKMKGDPSEVDLDNVFFASLGVAYQVSARATAGLIADWQEATSRFSDEALEAMAYLSYRVDDRWSVTGYAVAGFTDGSPDEGIGLQATYSYR